MKELVLLRQCGEFARKFSRREFALLSIPYYPTIKLETINRGPESRDGVTGKEQETYLGNPHRQPQTSLDPFVSL